MTKEGVEKIANGIVEYEECTYELEKYRKFAIVKEDKAWYQDPTLVIGGVTLSFAAGSLLTYLLVRDR